MIKLPDHANRKELNGKETKMNIEAEVQEKQKQIFTYTTTVQWLGDKIGSLNCEGKSPVTVSSPPEFKGTPNLWTPEEMFVGAIETCHMLTVLAFAQKRRLAIQSYTSHAEGVLEFIDGAYRFTHVAIDADIYVSDASEVALVKAVVEQAKSRCLISNSVSALVSYHAAVRVQ